MTNSKFLTGLGTRITELPLSKNMTQNDLAAQCDFEKASMSRIEASKTNITVLTLHKICKALDVEIVDFFNPDGKLNI